MAYGVFTDRFLAKLKSLIDDHQSIYPDIPPQGIYFENLVIRAFRQSGWADAKLVKTGPNRPREDLQVGPMRLSIKSETGFGTRTDEISITKLCTTEKEPWDSVTLIQRTIEHLSHYEHMLMLRAVWNGRGSIHYQLLEIPIHVLRLIGDAVVLPTGRREGRQSLGGDVYAGEERLFHVHFDGSDGKCQVRGLLVSRCVMLLEWDYGIPELLTLG